MDSFFTSRNQLDEQFGEMPAVVAEQFLEASVRRMVKLEGPLEAAKRLQRLSDICSGAYVLPLEHWRAIGKDSIPTPPAEPKRKHGTFDLIFGMENRPSFLMGIGAGVALSILIDLLTLVSR